MWYNTIVPMSGEFVVLYIHMHISIASFGEQPSTVILRYNFKVGKKIDSNENWNIKKTYQITVNILIILVIVQMN